jgi:hypothetical protein
VTGLLATAVAASVIGCAQSSDDAVDPNGTTTDPVAQPVLVVEQASAVDGPGISVEEAIARAGDGQGLLVNGALFIDPDGTARLCSAIAESFPPQCGGARLPVEGLDPAQVPDLQEENGQRWAESVQLFGVLEAGG